MPIRRLLPLLLALPLSLATGSPARAQTPATAATEHNLAPKATATASYTAANGMLMAVNDGRLPETRSPMEAWHSWAAGPDTVTVAYAWPTAITVDAIEVAWWYDQTEPGNGGVQRPLRAALEYWTGDAWAPVPGLRDDDGVPTTGVGTAGDGTTSGNTAFNRVAFDPVTTTRLRLVLAQNRTAADDTGTGIAEWRVLTRDPASIVFSEVGFVDPQWTTRDLALPDAAAGHDIRWSSDRPGVIGADGRVRRGPGEEAVTLTATATRPGAPSLTRAYPFRVLPAGAAGRTLELDLDRLGIEISPNLYGIFYEDICHALDGGLNANLVDNGSFQQYDWPTALPDRVSNRGPNDDRYSLDPREIYSWTAVGTGGAAGTATVVDTHPMNESNGYSVEVRVEAAGTGSFGDRADGPGPRAAVGPGPDAPASTTAALPAGFGIAANGYAERATNVREPSMPIEAGVGYDLSLWLQGDAYPGAIRVWLEDSGGALNSDVVEIRGLAGEWRKFTGRLTALRTADSRMVVAGDAPGTFRVDYVVLKPEPSMLWRDGAAGGLRTDMAQAMADLDPAFLRFPGGCATEGKSRDRLYNWKHTVGAPETRRQMPNYWGYWSSNEIGFYEYFLLAEELGSEPLPVVGLGMTCPFHRGPNYYEAPLDSPGCPDCTARYIATYVQDALDLIEFANGDVTTRWGRLRAEMGHPEPFGMKYISLGNENWGASFWERFDLMYDAVRKAHPEVTIVSTSGPFARGRELDDNYRRIDASYPATLVDEHYYMASSWFLANLDRYDPDSVRGDEGVTYDRDRPTRVFVGEYADANGANHFLSALYEAAFTVGLERNADMVEMSSYAPLFCKEGMTNWASNLVWFDDRGLWRTPNYWYRWIFANHVGDRAVPAAFSTYGDDDADPDVLTAPSLDTATGTVHLKIVNVDPAPKEVRVRLRGGQRIERRATYVRIASDDLLARNQGTSDYSEAIAPVTQDLGPVRDEVVLRVPGYSVGALVLEPATRERRGPE